jgi:hypothetical protein
MKTKRRNPVNEQHKLACMKALADHIGEEKALDMGILYERVFEKPPGGHKINSTRALRTIITQLREEGTPIGSVSTTNQGGYYLARSDSEVLEYVERLRKRGIQALKMAAHIKKKSLPEYLGQLRLSLEEGDHAEN